jgi:hypothetical protein
MESWRWVRAQVFIRAMAQKRLTAVGRVAAMTAQISVKCVQKWSKSSALMARAPTANPSAAVTPMAGAPRTASVRIASATV